MQLQWGALVNVRPYMYMKTPNLHQMVHPLSTMQITFYFTILYSHSVTHPELCSTIQFQKTSPGRFQPARIRTPKPLDYDRLNTPQRGRSVSGFFLGDSRQADVISHTYYDGFSKLTGFRIISWPVICLPFMGNIIWSRSGVCYLNPS